MTESIKLTEKEKIELSTAEAFINFYNCENITKYKARLSGSSPDIICEDPAKPTIHFEVTMTQDESGDIPALLGRSDKLSLKSLKEKINRHEKGEKVQIGYCLNDGVKDMLIEGIKKKLNKDYGKAVGLLIRDTSPLDWDWETILPEVKQKLTGERNPYQLGIWLVSKDKTKIRRVF